MYNRYIPQPDGSYRKNRVHEPYSPPQARRQAIPPKNQNTHPTPEPTLPPSEGSCDTPQTTPRHKSGNQIPSKENQDSITGFFKQLLPKNMDTGDLLIILLLLLMAGDCEEDRNNALLTLALYFFM